MRFRFAELLIEHYGVLRSEAHPTELLRCGRDKPSLRAEQLAPLCVLTIEYLDFLNAQLNGWVDGLALRGVLVEPLGHFLTEGLLFGAVFVANFEIHSSFLF